MAKMRKSDIFKKYYDSQKRRNRTMSRAYLCDCCGRFFDPNKERGSELNRNNFRLGSFAIDANKDLCADCTKQVENFIQVLEMAKRDGMIVQFKVFSDSNKEEQNND